MNLDQVPIGSVALEEEIALLLGWQQMISGSWVDPAGVRSPLPYYTRNQDDAKLLLPRPLVRFQLSFSSLELDMGDRRWRCVVNYSRAYGHTPELAICGAALKCLFS